MKRKILLFLLFSFISFTLLGCTTNTPSNNNSNNNGNSTTLPEDNNNPSDNDTQNNNQGSNSTDNNQNGDSSNDDQGNNSDNNYGDNSDDSQRDSSDDKDDNGETDKITLPADYVVTMSDMERFLSTKNEQYPLTNEYVELYQQESGGYIKNALNAGLVVDKTQHLPSQKWHYFTSWLYPTIEEGMLWDASASYRSYGAFQCPELILWIIEATGVETSKVEEAKDIAISGKANGVSSSSICGQIRAAVPWDTYLKPLVIEFLENNPDNFNSHNVTVNENSAYEITNLKDEYKERETVTLSILMKDNTKEINSVKVNDKVLEASSGTTYKFSMPDKDVNVVITLKDKSILTPPVEATNDYFYNIIYELPGKQAVTFNDPTQAYSIIQFNGTKENIISKVSEISVIAGGGKGGSGDSTWYGSNMLKIGSTSNTGYITFELTKSVTGVILTGYATNSSSKIKVGNGDNSTTLTAKDMTLTNKADIDAGNANTTSMTFSFQSTKTVTISTVNKYAFYITAIEFIVEDGAQ